MTPGIARSICASRLSRTLYFTMCLPCYQVCNIIKFATSLKIDRFRYEWKTRCHLYPGWRRVYLKLGCGRIDRELCEGASICVGSLDGLYKLLVLKGLRVALFPLIGFVGELDNAGQVLLGKVEFR